MTSTTKVPPINVEIIVNNKVVQMELETGAVRSIMPEAIYHELWPVSSERPELMKSSAKLRIYIYNGIRLSVMAKYLLQYKQVALTKIHVKVILLLLGLILLYLVY